ncbi:MAG: glycosyltransferase [Bacteroidetes bacterium]|nr:glycosyltransferase [Bacteroidota bacterium]
MKKVLFISFYWPPSGKASIHWPLKMIKYLPDYGWQPTVLVSKDDSFTAKDESLLNEIPGELEVIKSDFWDPFVYYKKFLGKEKDEILVASEAMSKTNKSLKHKFALWVRLNLFIPDARMGWYRPAVKEASEYLKNNKIDAIVSNGPPHISHLIGKKLSKKFNIPLVSVFIDPWVDISYYIGQKRNKLTLAVDNKLEKSVMKHSSRVVVVTNTLKDYFINKYPFIKNKIHVLRWGYNEDDFSKVENINSNEKVILHAGNIFDFQNIPEFWKTIKKQIEKGNKLKLKFIGTVSPAVKKTIEEIGLTGYTEYVGFLPYEEVLKELCKASYLLVCATEPRHFPGKLYEYMRAGKPIIAFGNDNAEVAEVLNETKSGILFRYEDTAEEFFEEAEKIKTDLEKVKQFDRKVISENLAVILNNIC